MGPSYVPLMYRIDSPPEFGGLAPLAWRGRARRLLACSSVIGLALFGCGNSSARPEPAASCAKLGDACTFAPGKLGLCIEPVDGRRGLVCQSQH